MLNKIPEVTLYFGLTGTSVVMSVLLAVFLVVQLRARKYVPWMYWLVVVLISVVGTLITDNLVDNFGTALETTAIAFGSALLATFGIHPEQREVEIGVVSGSAE